MVELILKITARVVTLMTFLFFLVILFFSWMAYADTKSLHPDFSFVDFLKGWSKDYNLLLLSLVLLGAGIFLSTSLLSLKRSSIIACPWLLISYVIFVLYVFKPFSDGDWFWKLVLFVGVALISLLWKFLTIQSVKQLLK